MSTRSEEFQEVRRLLRRPKHQCPDADAIISQLLRREQSMLNRMNGSGKGWTVATATVTSVVNTAEYAVTPAAGASFGKALFVYRDLGDNDILPVPHTDYSHELNNQAYDFWLTPTGSPEIYSGEKVAFFRDSAGVKMRIYPIPEEARTYTIKYATGRIDHSLLAWANTPALPEWAHIRTLSAALFLLPNAEWEGLDFNENRLRRQEIAMVIQAELQQEEPGFNAYLRNPTHEPIVDSGYWYEGI